MTSLNRSAVADPIGNFNPEAVCELCFGSLTPGKCVKIGHPGPPLRWTYVCADCYCRLEIVAVPYRRDWLTAWETNQEV